MNLAQFQKWALEQFTLLIWFNNILKKLTKLPVQEVPSPENPLLQAHVNDPGILVQAALASQLFVPLVHSSISVKWEMISTDVKSNHTKKMSCSSVCHVYHVEITVWT